MYSKLGNLGTATTGTFQAAFTALMAAKAAAERKQTESKKSHVQYALCNRERYLEGEK